MVLRPHVKITTMFLVGHGSMLETPGKIREFDSGNPMGPVDITYHTSKILPRSLSVYCLVDKLRQGSLLPRQREQIKNNMFFLAHISGKNMLEC